MKFQFFPLNCAPEYFGGIEDLVAEVDWRALVRTEESEEGVNGTTSSHDGLCITGRHFGTGVQKD